LGRVPDFVLNRAGDANFAGHAVAAFPQKNINARIGVWNACFDGSPEAEALCNSFDFCLDVFVIHTTSARLGEGCWRFGFKLRGRRCGRLLQNLGTCRRRARTGWRWFGCAGIRNSWWFLGWLSGRPRGALGERVNSLAWRLSPILGQLLLHFLARSAV